MGGGAQAVEIAAGQSRAQEIPPASSWMATTTSANYPTGFAPLQAQCTVAQFHQIAADPATLAHQLGLQPSEAITTGDLLRAAKHLGLMRD